jgi:flagellar basal-body rod protein FlgC
MSITAVSIASSGMNAASARLNAAASNIANAQTTGSLTDPAKAPYQPIDAVSKDIGTSGTPSGVVTSYQPRSSKPVAVSEPDSPHADANGMVGAPNVDIGEELISAMMAKYEFAANAKMMSAASDMQKTAIDILA